MADQLRYRTGHRPSPSEIRSWENSLPILASALQDAGLSKIEMLLEHQLPLSSKRVDVVLAGRHPHTGAPSYVLVELKQWTKARTWEGVPDLVQVEGFAHRELLHPILQIRHYCQYLSDFTRALEDEPDALAGAAFLHNADDRDVADLRRIPEDKYGRLFTASGRSAFLDFLRSRLDPDVVGAPYGDHLLNSAAAPSRHLLAVAADEIQSRQQFTLLDEQQIAFSLVMSAVEDARSTDLKTVVVVTGGPGSGKSVIALSLLGELARRGRAVMHATGSKSFTLTLRKIAGKGSTRTRDLFKYFNTFVAAEKNGLDVLILDEAHRIRETSVNRWTRAEHRSDRPQIEELLDAARVPVFLLDQNQVVRPGEMGTVEDIRRHADARGLRVLQVDLDTQFRCGGSEQFVDWVQRLLGLSGGGPVPWHRDPSFALQVVDSPETMEAVLRRKLDKHYSARMAAGYCWKWSDPRADGTLVRDVTIGQWSRPWNLRSERGLNGVPASSLWATQDGGFGQVGCVYTAQGHEYDWSGVIFGPDLVWRGDGWVARREANRDPDFKNRVKVSDLEFDRLVRNVYKVLLTRGMHGTLIYSTDAETNAYLRSLIPFEPLEDATPRFDEAPARTDSND